MRCCISRPTAIWPRRPRPRWDLESNTVAFVNTSAVPADHVAVSSGVYDGLNGAVTPATLVVEAATAISKLASEQYLQFFRAPRQRVELCQRPLLWRLRPYEAPARSPRRLQARRAAGAFVIRGDGNPDRLHARR
jgi:hypothetical protein